NRVRRVDLNGMIATYAGNGTAGVSTDGAQAVASPLYAAAGLATDSTGNLYIAPRFGGVWWRVNPAGVIHDIGGVVRIPSPTARLRTPPTVSPRRASTPIPTAISTSPIRSEIPCGSWC